MNLKGILISAGIVVLALVVYNMWIAKALKISAYEQAYEQIR